MKRIAVLISGRGSNMLALADSCKRGVLKGIANIVVVVSNRLDAKGLESAKEREIPTVAIASKGKSRLEFDSAVLNVLKSHEVDYVVLAGFMRRLSEVFTLSFSQRIINIHPADTKRHRGLGAYHWAWENKLESTIITIHFVNAEIDDGEIIAQAEVDLRGVTSLADVEARGLKIEHSFYANALKKVFAEAKSKNNNLCVE